MRLILVDPNKEGAEVLRWQFRDHLQVEVVCSRFEELPFFDCVVTAGNSFGLMDAGMDLAVVKFFGQHLGEQPVGSCLIVPTDLDDRPFVAHAPTMRIPMNIQGTDNVYLAMWATFTAVHRHNQSESRKIEALACPALGTGTGGMDKVEASLQMKLAYEHFLKPPTVINPTFAQTRHDRVYYGGRWGLEKPRDGSVSGVAHETHEKTQSRNQLGRDRIMENRIILNS